jgi:hypothetical protein
MMNYLLSIFADQKCMLPDLIYGAMGLIIGKKLFPFQL